jgi:hypothetical protein
MTGPTTLPVGFIGSSMTVIPAPATIQDVLNVPKLSLPFSEDFRLFPDLGEISVPL